MANTYKVGDSLKFKAYSQETPDGKLVAGETVKVIELKNDDSYIVESASGAKEHVFFPDEVEPVAAAEVKTRTKPAAKTEAKADAKATGTAKVKGAAKPADKEKAKVAAAKTKEKEKADKAKADAKAKKDKEKADAKAAKDKAKEEAAAAKAAAKAEAEKPIVIVDTDAVTAVIEEAGDALKAAMSLKGQIDESYFSLGGVLAHINNEGLYKNEGPEYAEKGGFKLYCDNVLEIGYSRAMYWIGIYMYFTGMGLSETELAGVGWSKAKELVDATTDKDQALALIEFAGTHSKSEVIEHVKAFVTQNGGTTAKPRGANAEKAKRVSFKFQAMEAEAETVTAAMKRAKELVEGDDDNKAFLHIMTEWAMSVDGAEVTLADAVTALNARFNTKLVESLGDDKYVDPTDAEAVAAAKPAPAPAAKAKGKGKAKAA